MVLNGFLVLNNHCWCLTETLKLALDTFCYYFCFVFCNIWQMMFWCRVRTCVTHISKVEQHNEHRRFLCASVSKLRLQYSPLTLAVRFDALVSRGHILVLSIIYIIFQLIILTRNDLVFVYLRPWDRWSNPHIFPPAKGTTGFRCQYLEISNMNHFPRSFDSISCTNSISERLNHFIELVECAQVRTHRHWTHISVCAR